MDNKGVWKKDPRGVDYISFTMPDSSRDSGVLGPETTFQFTTPVQKSKVYVRIKNADDILGVIVLIKPEKYED